MPTDLIPEHLVLNYWKQIKTAFRQNMLPPGADRLVIPLRLNPAMSVADIRSQVMGEVQQQYTRIEVRLQDFHYIMREEREARYRGEPALSSFQDMLREYITTDLLQETLQRSSFLDMIPRDDTWRGARIPVPPSRSDHESFFDALRIDNDTIANYVNDRLGDWVREGTSEEPASSMSLETAQRRVKDLSEENNRLNQELKLEREMVKGLQEELQVWKTKHKTS